MIESTGNPVWTIGLNVLTVLTIAGLLWQAYLVLGH